MSEIRKCIATTFNYRNDHLCRLREFSMQGFVIRTYRKDGFGSQWQRIPQQSLDTDLDSVAVGERQGQDRQRAKPACCSVDSRAQLTIRRRYPEALMTLMKLLFGYVLFSGPFWVCPIFCLGITRYYTKMELHSSLWVRYLQRQLYWGTGFYSTPYTLEGNADTLVVEGCW